jgi:hypothetical protein
MTDGVWGQCQEKAALRSENAQLKAQLREFQYVGQKDIVSMEKVLEVVRFIQSELGDLAEAVFHVTDVSVSELWTFESTTPGRAGETIRGLGATVLSRRQHEEALSGRLGKAYADANAQWGIEKLRHAHQGRDRADAQAAQGGDQQSDQTEALRGLIWGSRFLACDDTRTVGWALFCAFTHHRKTHNSTCAMECNTLEKCHV